MQRSPQHRPPKPSGTAAAVAARAKRPPRAVLLQSSPTCAPVTNKDACASSTATTSPTRKQAQSLSPVKAPGLRSSTATSLPAPPRVAAVLTRKDARQRAAPLHGLLPSSARPLPPVVHIRIRPLLPHLHETSDTRTVWFLDHENMVVRTGAGLRAAKAAASTGRMDVRGRRQHVRSSAGHHHRPVDQPKSASSPADEGLCCKDGLASPPSDSLPTRSPGGASQTAERSLSTDDGGSSSSSCSNGSSEPRALDDAVLKQPAVLPLPADGLRDRESVNTSLQRTLIEAKARRPGQATKAAERTPCAAGAAQARRRPPLPHANAPVERKGRCADGTHPTAAAAAHATDVPGDDPAADHRFRFEFIHDEAATQEEVFEESVLRFVDEALLAQNVAILCYGPTGSGKTYSMMGRTPAPSAAARSGAAVRPPRLPLSAARQEHTRGPSPPQTGVQQTEEAGAAAATPPVVRRASIPRHPGGDRRADVNDHWSTSPTAWSRSRQQALLNGRAVESVERGEQQLTVVEMGILPRLVRVLLDRRGESLTLHREADAAALNESTGGHQHHHSPSHGARPAASHVKRPADPAAAYDLTLTLRELTFFGVEIYLDELSDLLDPMKRPVPSVGDTGGLAALCASLNHASAAHTRGQGQKRAGGGGTPIRAMDDLRRAYHLACRNRVTSAHHRNHASSRSHAVFILQLSFDLVDSRAAARAAPATPQRVHSFVALVDLAGCERIKETQVEGAALREARYINKSLSALSSVVLALHQRAGHVPYRDSKLTRLLRPCLEQGRVLTVVHVAPCSSADTMNSLKFADTIRHARVQTHGFDASTQALQDIFAGLVDSSHGQLADAVQQTEAVHAQLCAEVRLAYLTRTIDHTQPSSRRSSLRIGERCASLEQDEVGRPSDASCVSVAVSAPSESLPALMVDEPPCSADGDGHGDAADRAAVAARVALWEQSPTARATGRRSFIVQQLVERHLALLRATEEEELRVAVQQIRDERDRRVEAARSRREQRRAQLREAIAELELHNARLHEESTTPLPRDPYALEVSRLVREANENLREGANARWHLTAVVNALRQRVAVQGELQHLVEEELAERLEMDGRLLQGVGERSRADDPPLSSSRLPTSVVEQGRTAPTDAAMRDVGHQQVLLAAELAVLRLEVACFYAGNAIWEGLWARAMRSELLAAARAETHKLESLVFHPSVLRCLTRGPPLPPAAPPQPLANTTHAAARAPSEQRYKDQRYQLHGADVGPHNSLEDDLRSRLQSVVRATTKAREPVQHQGLLSSRDNLGSLAAAVSTQAAAGGYGTSTLIGSYGDEERLQRAALRRLMGEGIVCEVCCVGEPFHAVLREYLCPAVVSGEGDAVPRAARRSRTAARPEDRSAKVSAAEDAHGDGSNAPHEADVKRSEPPSRVDRGHPPCTTHTGRMRLTRLPEHANQYCLEFTHTSGGIPPAASDGRAEANSSTKTACALEDLLASRAAEVGCPAQAERRLFSLPLGEASLYLSVHVLEPGTTRTAPRSTAATSTDASRDGDEDVYARDSSPAVQVAIELTGVPEPPHASASSSARPGGSKAAAQPHTSLRDVVLARRLPSGAELLLPSCCSADGRGVCTLLVRFPAGTTTQSTALEAVEVLVAGLCGVCAPSVMAGGTFSLASAAASRRRGDAPSASPSPERRRLASALSRPHAACIHGVRTITCTAAHIPYALLFPSAFLRSALDNVGADGSTPTPGDAAAAPISPVRRARRSTATRGTAAAARDTTPLGAGATLQVHLHFPASPPRHIAAPPRRTDDDGWVPVAHELPRAPPSDPAEATRASTEDPSEDGGTDMVQRSVQLAARQLQRLRAVTINSVDDKTGCAFTLASSSSPSPAVVSAEVEQRFEQLFAFRRGIRAVVKQHIYAAEDTQDEVAPPAVARACTRRSALEEVVLEARQVIDLRLPTVAAADDCGRSPRDADVLSSASADSAREEDRHPPPSADTEYLAGRPRAKERDAASQDDVTRRRASGSLPVMTATDIVSRVAPHQRSELQVAQGREVCGPYVPWTIWQWAYRWAAVAQCAALCELEDMSCTDGDDSAALRDSGRRFLLETLRDVGGPATDFVNASSCMSSRNFLQPDTAVSDDVLFDDWSAEGDSSAGEVVTAGPAATARRCFVLPLCFAPLPSYLASLGDLARTV